MTYELEFNLRTLKEQHKLGGTMRAQFRKKLADVLLNPRIDSTRLNGLPDCQRIKLESSGFRLVYQVRDEVVAVFVAAVGKREHSAVYYGVNEQLQRLMQVMYNLVTAAAPDQCRVFKILHKFTISQHVDEIHHLHLCGVGFIKLVAGPHPDILPRALSVNTLYQSQDIQHVLRTQWIAAGRRNTLVRDSHVVQIGNDLVFHLFDKRLARIESPGAFVVAARAFMYASRYRQGATSTRAVDDIDGVVLVVAHSGCPESMQAG